MHEDDGTTRDALVAELAAAIEETARLHRELDAIEADLARVVELYLRAAGRADPTLDLPSSFGSCRRTLH